MRNPEAVAAMKEADWEIASHGLKWIDYRDFSAEEERAHMSEAIRIHTEVTGERPLGWYTGRTSEHTNRLVAEEGGFLYSADSYADELPYWEAHGERQQLIVPYTLDANDMRFGTPQGFNSGDQFFAYLKDSFDTLYAEGETAPKMLSVGLHCRLVGRPGRAAALARFLDYVASHENVWIAKRIDIARHWIRRHRPADVRPSTMNRALFVELFGDIFEHSPWIAERSVRCRPRPPGRILPRDFTPPWCECSPRRRTSRNLRSSTRIPILPGASSSPTSPPIRGASNPPPGSTP